MGRQDAHRWSRYGAWSCMRICRPAGRRCRVRCLWRRPGGYGSAGRKRRDRAGAIAAGASAQPRASNRREAVSDASTAPESSLDEHHPLDADASAEPFGVRTLAATDEQLSGKWQGVRNEIDVEAKLLDTCRADAEHCPWAAARFLAIAAVARGRDGRARLGEVNRAVNLAIRPMSDLAQYGVIDQWSAPLNTLARGAGDCEDYAIAKFAALREAGVAEDDLRLLVVRDIKQRQDHAVLAARSDGRWLVLDNRRLLLLQDTQLSDYVPLFTLGSQGIRMVVGYGMQAANIGRDTVR
jgi:predicted transglutaminase-like cysteine proteinase